MTNNFFLKNEAKVLISFEGKIRPVRKQNDKFKLSTDKYKNQNKPTTHLYFYPQVTLW